MKKLKILLLSSISIFFLANNAHAQCPTSVNISANAKCLEMVWPVPPDPLPSPITINPDIYTLRSGNGTSGIPAFYIEQSLNNGNGCNNYVGFSGTLTYPGLTCTYENGILTSTLPLNLIFFELVSGEGRVELHWMIHGNNESFEIERSNGNNDWTVIGKINSGRKSEANGTEFNFKDDYPQYGDNYYRLKILNWNGEHEYSVVLYYFHESKSGITFYPNPVTDQLFISGQNSSNEIIKIEIYDLLGYKIKEINTPGNSVDFSQFRSGTYMLRSRYRDGSELIGKVSK